ncbi:MAG TPA: tetratricopeptide repeat protein, partial [Flavobacteriales bacterium]|nr:tetratricopeptide repeat protein [Flavobacteriales bacterium]
VWLLLSACMVMGQKDSLLRIVGTVSDKDKADIYRQLADLTLRSEPENCLKFAKKSVEYADKVNDKWCKAYALRLIAIYYDEHGDYKKSIEHLEEALRINREINDKSGISACLSSFGIIYYNQSKFDKALEVFLEVIKYYDSDKMAYNKSLTLSNIAAIYKYNGDLPSAIDYYRQSYRLMQLANSKRGLAISANNLGMVFYSAKQKDSALHYLHEGLDIKRSLNDKKSLAYSLSNLSEVYIEYGDRKKSLAYLQECITLQKEINDIKGLSGSYISAGDLQAKNPEMIEAAVKNYVDAFEIAKQIGDLHTAQVASFKAGNLYYNLKDYQKAADYVYAYTTYKDSLYSSEKAKAFAEMQTKFDTERKEKEIAILNHQNKIKELELTRANTERQKREQEILLLAKAKEIKEALLEKEKARGLVQKKQNEVLRKDKQIQEAKLEQERVEKEKLDIENRKRAQQLTGLAIGSLLLLFLLFFAIRSYRQKKKANDLLGKQNKEITQQKEEIQVKNHIITEKQKEIVDSINYAKRIQYALLANDELMKNKLTEYFVFFKPKDIVSGDFYWATETVDSFFVAVCDSTGHGVPGAFMSLLNISFLNEAITEKDIHEPNKVFDYVRQRLIANISQDGGKDGMDGILLHIDKKTRKIMYAASNNAPFLVGKNEVQELSVDKMPVGMADNLTSFSVYEINYAQGDMLYLYTDGYADQFGGEKGKKFKNSNLKKFLSDISSKPMREQQTMLANQFEEWRGDLEQIDDVCVMGIKL